VVVSSPAAPLVRGRYRRQLLTNPEQLGSELRATGEVQSLEGAAAAHDCAARLPERASELGAGALPAGNGVERAEAIHARPFTALASPGIGDDLQCCCGQVRLRRRPHTDP
jgi:uncharacterized membrane protein YcjF (UPF0283 family)